MKIKCIKLMEARLSRKRRDKTGEVRGRMYRRRGSELERGSFKGEARRPRKRKNRASV